jgi:NitT/TauT family transport system substrate-binding protein
MRVGFMAALTTLAVSLSGCGDRSPAAAFRIRVALARSPYTYLPVYLAEPLGFYRDEHLAVTLEEFPGGAKAVEAVLGGSADIAAGFYEHTIQMAAEGRPFRSFVTMLRYPGMALVVSPKASRRIARIEDLKNAIVGVGTPGSPTHFYLNYLLSRHGMKPGDVAVVGVGAPATAAAAVEHGKVDAAVVGGALVVLQQRYPALVVLAESFSQEGVRQSLQVDEYPGATLLAPASWLQQNASAARHMARAILRTLDWIHAHTPEQLRQELPPAYRTDEQTDLASLRLFLPLFSHDGRMNPASASAARRVLAVSVDKVRDSNIDLEQTYTNAFVAAP